VRLNRGHASERRRVTELKSEERLGGLNFDVRELSQVEWQELAAWTASDEWVTIDDLFQFRTLAQIAGRSVEEPSRDRLWLDSRLVEATSSRGSIKGSAAMLGYVKDLAMAISLDSSIRESHHLSVISRSKVVHALDVEYRMQIRDVGNSLQGKASYGPANIPDWFASAQVIYPDDPELFTLHPWQARELLEIAERVKGSSPWQCQLLFLGLRRVGLLDSPKEYFNKQTFDTALQELEIDSTSQDFSMSSKLWLMWEMTLASAESVTIDRDGKYEICLAAKREGLAELPPRTAV